jgi:hypothetical protein
MKRLISLLVVVLYVTNQTNACTVCGCSASNQYLGILPQSKTSFVGIQYQFRAFNSMHIPEAGETIAKTSVENYHTVQIWGRYNISDRIQLFAFVPYISNERIEGGVKSNLNGLGDATILINYHVLGANCKGKEWRHNLLAGGGVKLPTGKYDDYSIKYNDGLPNMQPGTSSYDFIINANYTFQHNNTGVNTDLSYVVTTQNADKYKFGNRLNLGLNAFHTIKIKQYKIIPLLGARYEIAGCDYDNYSLGLKNDMSGGNQLYVSIGMQAYYSKIGIQAMLLKPVIQNYASGMVSNNYKAEAGVYFLFKY